MGEGVAAILKCVCASQQRRRRSCIQSFSLSFCTHPDCLLSSCRFVSCLWPSLVFLNTHLLWLMTRSAKSFLRQTTFFFFLNLAEVSFYQRSHQRAETHANWETEGPSELQVLFFIFMYFFLDSTKPCKWMSALCWWQDAWSVLVFDVSFICRSFLLYFGGACESHFWLFFFFFSFLCKNCWVCF